MARVPTAGIAAIARGHYASGQTDIGHSACNRALHGRVLRSTATPRSSQDEGLNAGTRPEVDLMVATPFANAGKRSDPPISLP